MNMNQTEFAEKLNVTFATVNRWENGRALPNKLAQDKMYALCKEQNVSVYDIVIEKIETAANSFKLEPGRVLLYHGSKSGIAEEMTKNNDLVIGSIVNDRMFFDEIPDQAVKGGLS